MITIPGKRSRQVFEKEQKYIAPGLQSIALYTKLTIEKGRGVYLTDADGNNFIDLTAGIGVGSIGHCHPHFVSRMKEQVEKVTFGSFTTPNRAQFLKLLATVSPNGLNRTQLYSSGAEAVEASFRLAKSVTKKFEFVGFWGGFHGKTGGVLGLLADTSFKKELGPFMPGLYSSPYAYCYRCPFETTFPKCGLACAEHLRTVIKTQTQQKIAAIIIEPIQGTAGNVVPPPGFLKAVKEIAKEFNGLLIADEMLTGFGRTGKMWGCEHDGVVPDVVTVGKGIGGGFPMSGIMSSLKLASAKPFGNPSGSSSSYGGNPLASTAGLAALEVINKENLVENSRKIGARMLKRLKALQSKYSIIGDVRGKGLLIGVELVKNRKTREPLGKDVTMRLFQECMKRGMISMCYSHNIRINPPLVITQKEADKAVDIFDEAFAAIKKPAKGRN